MGLKYLVPRALPPWAEHLVPREINNPNRGGGGGKTAHLNGHALGFHPQT